LAANRFLSIESSCSLCFYFVSKVFSAFLVSKVFPAEIPIFRREHFNGMYSVLAYYVSKTTAELPNFIVLPLVHCLIVYFMFGKIVFS